MLEFLRHDLSSWHVVRLPVKTVAKFESRELSWLHQGPQRDSSVGCTYLFAAGLRVIMIDQPILPICFLRCATVSKGGAAPVLFGDAQTGTSYLCRFTLAAE
jgi:hypothetical protein